ncbi:MAG TPA: sulfatase-like hydrolase/transferase [Acidimicrobiia bacterium]|nr:sulfatase-like hydrolase/transferase [Acidimicrobiia bacterium]
MTLPKIDRRRVWRRSLVILGLMTAGVAAPVLDLYGRNPGVFVANRSTPEQIVMFGLLVTFTLPLVAVIILTITEKISSGAADVAYYLLVGISAAATGLVISRQVVPENTVGAVSLAIGVTVVVLLLRRRIEPGLLFFSLLGPAVLVMFLAISPTSRLLAEPATPPVTPNQVGNPASIFIIQLDELPLASLMDETGAINADLFPNFARLASSGNWYRNALSNSIATTSSVPAILSGRLGEKDDSPSLIDHPNNLFTLLGEGYEMHVVEWLTDMCPEELCKDYAGRGPARFGSLLQDVGVVYGHLSLPVSARASLPSIDGSWKGFLGQAESREAAPVDVGDLLVPRAGVRSKWIDWIERIIDGVVENAPPTLHFAHLQAPHIPWRVNPSGSHYQRPEQYDEVDGVEGGGHWVTRPDLPRLAYQRYLYQLGFVDQRLGALFDRMDETGNWDDSLIVVLADHGASFVPGEHRRWPEENNRSDLYRIPLFIKLPGQVEGRTYDEPAFAIDVVPTIVDALDITTDWEFDGRSLLTIEGSDRHHVPIFYCCNREPASTDLNELFGQVRRNHEWVPNQESWMGVAGSGPFADFVGRPVAELAPQPSNDLRWSLTQAEELAAVSRASGLVQTFISGRLELPAGIEGDDFLVAVNGTVAGTGFVIRDSDTSGEIRGLLAEELVVDGANEVVILVPDPRGDGWLTGAAADITLDYIAEDGHQLDIRSEGDRRLEISAVQATETGWLVKGWAADVSEKLTADWIYVFAGDQLLVSGPPNLDNENVVRWFKSDDLLRSGFTFDIPADQVPDDLDRLTVIAEFGDYAIESPATVPR